MTVTIRDGETGREKAAPKVALGWELLKRPGLGPGHTMCLEHGNNPPVRQLLAWGEVFMVCELCITSFCDIGAIERAEPTGERRSCELDEGEGCS